MRRLLPVGTLSATSYTSAVAPRDQYIHPEEEKEKALILRPETVVGGQMMQIQCALLPSQHFEYVRGSHNRWDTPEELLVRKGGEARENRFSDDMPGAERDLLNPGDALVFCPWVIHRGHCELLKILSVSCGLVPCFDATRVMLYSSHLHFNVFSCFAVLGCIPRSVPSDLVDEPRCSLMFTYSNGPRPTCKSRTDNNVANASSKMLMPTVVQEFC